jgi:hypothetical protein
LPFSAIEKLPEDKLQGQAAKDLIHPLYYKQFLDSANNFNNFRFPSKLPMYLSARIIHERAKRGRGDA